MAIIHVRPDDRLHLESIASLFGAASKIVTITGAGISTNAGIPLDKCTAMMGQCVPQHRHIIFKSATFVIAIYSTSLTMILLPLPDFTSPPSSGLAFPWHYGDEVSEPRDALSPGVAP